MKKFFFSLFLMSCIIPGHLLAQYSNASLNGPWIIDIGGSGDVGVAYIIFNGSGSITSIGAADDSLYPVGTYSVSASGVIAATLNMIGSTHIIIGQMINDSSANLYDTSKNQDIYSYTVSNPGALAGTWSGYVYDSSSQYTRNITLTVNGAGAITAATGIPLTSGNIFAGRDTFAGYIITTDDSCAFTKFQIGGIQAGDSLIGMSSMGPRNSTCETNGHVVLTNHSLGIHSVNAGVDFSVYPNPFTDRIDIALNHPGQKMQADLYDLYGRKVLSQSLGSDQNASLNAGSLGSGFYLLTLTDQDGNTTTKRVVKN